MFISSSACHCTYYVPLIYIWLLLCRNKSIILIFSAIIISITNSINIFLKGVRCWEVIQKRFSHLGLNILSAIHGMSAISDVRYCEVSLYNFIFFLIYTYKETFQCLCHKETPLITERSLGLQ